MRIIMHKIDGRQALQNKPLTSSLEYHFLRDLTEAFEKSGWQIESRSRRKLKGQRIEADLVVEKAPFKYVIELKAAREGRRRSLRGLIADAILQSKWQAERLGDANALAVVGAPHLSDALASNLREYVARFSPGQAYGLIDQDGRLQLEGPGLEGIRPVRMPPQEPAPLAQKNPLELFSDLNQWMLKVLLAQSLPSDLLHAPRALFRNAADLARVARVSVPSAYRLVARLRQEGFLDQASSLRLVRVGDLLERWRASNLRSSIEIAAKWLIPSAEPHEQLHIAVIRYTHEQRRRPAQRNVSRPRSLVPISRPRICLGLFAACAEIGYGFVHGAPLHVYLEQLDPTALDALGLSGASPGQRSDILIRIPRSPESVFRAAVHRNGVPVADIVQIWLDVKDHPVRGAEQAQRIWEQVLYRLEQPPGPNG